MINIKQFYIIFLLISNVGFSQSIQQEWQKFKSESWTVKYVPEKSIYLGKEIQGKLYFENTSSKKSAGFYIFHKSDNDENLKREIIELTPMLNCNSDIEKHSIRSFTFGNYYYLLQPCKVCFVYDKECKLLSLNLKKFIEK